MLILIFPRLTFDTRNHLHNLFEMIDKEVDNLIAENVTRKFGCCCCCLSLEMSFFTTVRERVETLEDILISSGHVQSESDRKNLQQQKPFSVSSVKRDSMVAGKWEVHPLLPQPFLPCVASHLSQKIKSTYKLKTSSKIFKGQSNSSCHLIGSYEWHKDGIWYITSSQKNGRQYIATASAGMGSFPPIPGFKIKMFARWNRVDLRRKQIRQPLANPHLHWPQVFSELCQVSPQ